MLIMAWRQLSSTGDPPPSGKERLFVAWSPCGEAAVMGDGGETWSAVYKDRLLSSRYAG